MLRSILKRLRGVTDAEQGRWFVAELRVLGCGRLGTTELRLPRLGAVRGGRMMLQWLRATLRGDVPAADESLRRYARLAPGPLVEFVLASQALDRNRPREALAILHRLDPDTEELAHWLPYWDVLAAAYHLLAHYEDELRAAQEAARRFPGRPLPAGLGRVDEVERLRGQQLDHPETALVLGEELRAHGHTAASRAAFERVLAWYGEQPLHRVSGARHRHLYGDALIELGRWSEASDVFAALAARDPMSPAWLGHVGMIAALRGDREEAGRIAARLAGLRHPYLPGEHTRYRARIAALLGDGDQAVRLLKDSFAEGAPHGIGLHRDRAFAGLRGHRPFQELIRPRA
jgi:predicted Zn-dependent protease